MEDYLQIKEDTGQELRTYYGWGNRSLQVKWGSECAALSPSGEQLFTEDQCSPEVCPF